MGWCPSRIPVVCELFEELGLDVGGLLNIRIDYQRESIDHTVKVARGTEVVSAADSTEASGAASSSQYADPVSRRKDRMAEAFAEVSRMLFAGCWSQC